MSESLRKDLLRLGGALLAITVAVALCLGCVDTLTRDRIARIKEENIQNAMREVCGADASFEPMTLSPEEDSTITSASRILRQGKHDGFCLQVEPMGFGGAITMIVGVDGQGAVLGVEIVELSETPGLGAKADDVKWLAQYQGASGSLNVVKAATGNPGDITALSGATITSKGVTAGVQTALDFAARQ